MRRALSDWLFHAVLGVGIICGVALASSASSQVVQWEGMVPDSRYPTHDRWGNKYPPVCRKDLSFLIGRYVTVERKNLVGMLGPNKRGLRRAGWFEGSEAGSRLAGRIYIDDSIGSHLYEYVLHHELCHAICWMLYGNMEWHEDTE